MIIIHLIYNIFKYLINLFWFLHQDLILSLCIYLLLWNIITGYNFTYIMFCYISNILI